MHCIIITIITYISSSDNFLKCLIRYLLTLIDFGKRCTGTKNVSLHQYPIMNSNCHVCMTSQLKKLKNLHRLLHKLCSQTSTTSKIISLCYFQSVKCYVCQSVFVADNTIKLQYAVFV